MRNVYLFIIFVLIHLFSCNEDNVVEKNIEKIIVECEDVDVISHINYFKNLEVINLETSKMSLIHKIDRLYFYCDKIFILDKKQMSIFVFGSDGKFHCKICNVGRGPEEYNQIGDFTIDETDNEIIVSMEIPKEVYIYDLSGNFKKRFKVNNCYGANITVVRNKIVLVGVNERFDYVSHEYEKSSGELVRSIDEKCTNSYNYPMIRGVYPNMIKSSKSYYNQPLGRTIISLDDSVRRCKYLIDFFDCNLPIDINNQLVDLDIMNYCRDNNFKTLISSFRENKDYIFFRYEPVSFVLYHKETKSMKVFSHIKDLNTGVKIYNIFPHDGSFNGVISIMNPIDVVLNSELIERNKIEVTDSVLLNLRNLVKETDNPIILKYAFK